MANALPLLLVGGAALYLLSKKGNGATNGGAKTNGNGKVNGKTVPPNGGGGPPQRKPKVLETARYIDALADGPFVPLRDMIPGDSIVITSAPIEKSYFLKDWSDAEDFVEMVVNESARTVSIVRNDAPITDQVKQGFNSATWIPMVKLGVKETDGERELASVYAGQNW